MIILIIALLLFVFTDSLLWIAGVLLALFYVGVDVYNIDKADASGANEAVEYPAHETGVLGHYEIDSTPSYGLFLSLCGNPVFVDIREDKFIDQREKFAKFLAKNAESLEQSLNGFVQAHPDYSLKRIDSIGLHAKNLEQGEVFWHPDGYTILKGLEFLD